MKCKLCNALILDRFNRRAAKFCIKCKNKHKGDIYKLNNPYKKKPKTNYDVIPEIKEECPDCGVWNDMPFIQCSNCSYRTENNLKGWDGGRRRREVLKLIHFKNRIIHR